MPKLGGFTKYVKKHLDTGAIAMVLGGLALPTIAQRVYSALNLGTYLRRVPVIGDNLTHPVAQAGLATVVSAALTYGLASAGIMKESTALGMNMIALGVFAASAIGAYSSTAQEYLPYTASFSGMHGMAGYSNGGGYLGYLGNVDTSMDMLTTPEPAQMFGSSPSFNVF